MLLNFWKSLTLWFLSLAAKTHRKALETAKDRIVLYKQAYEGNMSRIVLLERANIELQNATDELQDWIDKNSNGNVIL
jgi:hypothetical protein